MAASAAFAQPNPPAGGKDCGCEVNAGKLPFSDEEVLKSMLPPLPADAPRPSADPRNFEGTWLHNQVTVRRADKGLYAKAVPFTKLGLEVRDRRAAGARGEVVPFSNASAECRAPGQPWLMELYYPFQIYQSGKNVTFMYAYIHSRWDIRMGGEHRGQKQYLGDSVGHWDGNTLVVETTNYARGMWLDSNGTPTSRQVKLTHRIRRIDEGEPMLEIMTTVDDPVMYTKPWSFVRTYAWRPDKTIFDEYDCEYEVGASGNTSNYGLQPEPVEY